MENYGVLDSLKDVVFGVMDNRFKEFELCNNVSYNLRRGSIKGSSHLFADLHYDSLGFIELVLVVEEEFGVEIPDEEADKIKLVKDFMRFIDYENC